MTGLRRIAPRNPDNTLKGRIFREIYCTLDKKPIIIQIIPLWAVILAKNPAQTDFFFDIKKQAKEFSNKFCIRISVKAQCKQVHQLQKQKGNEGCSWRGFRCC